MNKLENKRQVNSLALLLTVTYMVSYVTRTNFGAIVSEISHATGITKSLLSMPLTGSFITYGVGQLFSGFLGDRMSPKKLVSLGLVTTVAMNILIPLCVDPWMMLAVWCINGLAQAFMWPPIVRIMVALLAGDNYKKAATQVSCGGSLGTILVYLTAPLLITTVGWKGTFYFAAALGAIMLITWNRFAPDIQEEHTTKRSSDGKISMRVLFTPLILCVLLTIILQGGLRDGITTWMPSFISESFHLGNEISILSGVLLPIFGIICIRFADWFYRNVVKNPMACAGCFLGAAAVFALMLYLFCETNVVCSVLFSAALIGSINGVNLILIGMLPQYFEKYGNTSTISGVLNSCTYIGSAISTYGIAALSEGIGWSNTILIWVLAALAGGMICLLCVRPWKKEFETSNN